MTSNQGKHHLLSHESSPPPYLTLVRPATMAEHGTRPTTTDRLEEAIAALSERHSDLANKFEAWCERLSHLTSASPASSQPSPHPQPPVKLDVPRFDGHDPLGWIFKVSQFFDYQWPLFTSMDQLSAGFNGCSGTISSRPGQPFSKQSKQGLHLRSTMIHEEPCSSLFNAGL